MLDSAVAVGDTVMAIASVGVAIGLGAAVVRRRVPALAALGPVLLLVSVAAATWQPTRTSWDGGLNIAGYALVFASYPDGRFESRWLALPVAGFLGLGAAYLIAGPSLAGNFWWGLLPLAVLGLAPVLVHRYRRRLSTLERERTRWAVLGALVTFGGMTLLVCATVLAGTTTIHGPWAFGPIVLVPALPLALACGLLTPRAAAVDALIGRVLQVLLCAFPVVVVTGLLIRLLSAESAAWVAVAVVALGLVPWSRRAGRLAERFAYGQRLSPAAAAAALDSRLRSELVIAREEERRQLRRDLHDELAPTLVGLRLTAAGLAQALHDREPRVAEAARAMTEDVESALAQTRALAYGLRPPGLDDAGLVAAVRTRTRAGEGVRIEVTADDESPNLPAAVELAALRVVTEAVANVRRHSRARRCTIAITRPASTLRVLIDDDGTGLPPRTRPGIGLVSMRQRVEELGGWLRLGRSPLGGLQVEAIFPVPSPRPDQAPAETTPGQREDS